MQKFELVLKNDKIKSYRTLAMIILLLNLVIFIFMLFYDQYRYQAASAILLVGIYIFMRLYFIKKYQQGNYLDQVLLFVLAGCWLGLDNYLMVTALGVLGILYHLSLQKLLFLFTPEKITRIGFPAKEFEWSSLSNVILKNRILTLDFKNNHLIQAEIETEGINEQQFNSFAQSRLNRKLETSI